MDLAPQVRRIVVEAEVWMIVLLPLADDPAVVAEVAELVDPGTLYVSIVFADLAEFLGDADLFAMQLASPPRRQDHLIHL